MSQDTPRGALSETRLVVITDHTALLRGRMPHQFRDKPRIEALLAAIGSTLQGAEEQAADVLLGLELSGATGAALERWGELVGEPRGALTDDDTYRRFIRARLLANGCRGTVDELLAIWELITGPSEAVRHRLLPPAGLQLWVQRTAFLTDVVQRRVVRLMTDVEPGGITLSLSESLTGRVGVGASWTGLGTGLGRVLK